MKRTFRRPDGTEEVLEGTAEELAEYERKLNESPRKAPKPGVLKGKGLADLLKEIAGDESVRDMLDRLRPERDPLDPLWPFITPTWVPTPCSSCGKTACQCGGWNPLAPWFTITMGGSSTEPMKGDQRPGLSKQCLDSSDS